jgi:hypothetical protein
MSDITARRLDVVKDDSFDPTIRRVFRQIADSEGPDFDQTLDAMQGDQESFPPTEDLYETLGLLWEAFQTCRPELGGMTPHAQLLA